MTRMNRKQIEEMEAAIIEQTVDIARSLGRRFEAQLLAVLAMELAAGSVARPATVAPPKRGSR